MLLKHIEPEVWYLNGIKLSAVYHVDGLNMGTTVLEGEDIEITLYGLNRSPKEIGCVNTIEKPEVKGLTYDEVEKCQVPALEVRLEGYKLMVKALIDKESLSYKYLLGKSLVLSEFGGKIKVSSGSTMPGRHYRPDQLLVPTKWKEVKVSHPLSEILINKMKSEYEILTVSYYNAEWIVD